MAKNTVQCPICGGVMRTKYSKRGDKHTCLDPNCAYVFTTGGKKNKTRNLREKRGGRQDRQRDFV